MDKIKIDMPELIEQVKVQAKLDMFKQLAGPEMQPGIDLASDMLEVFLKRNIPVNVAMEMAMELLSILAKYDEKEKKKDIHE